MTEPTDALEACPFCWGKAFIQGPSLSASGWHGLCDDCGAMGPQFRSKNPGDDDRAIADATRAWNTRHRPATPNTLPDAGMEIDLDAIGLAHLTAMQDSGYSKLAKWGADYGDKLLSALRTPQPAREAALEEAYVAAIWHSAMRAYDHDGIGERDDDAAIADLSQSLSALKSSGETT